MNKKPNIIFMLTDDQRYDAMGFMGNNQVHTPNLDKLAHDGVRFSNAFHVAPICMPSRATIQLGKYISQHHCGFDLPTNYTVSTEEYNQSYPVLLRENGYYTGFIGKFGFPVSEEKVHKNKRRLSAKSPKDDPYYENYDNADETCKTTVGSKFDYWKGFGGKCAYIPDEKTGKINGYENPKHLEHLTDLNTDQAQIFLENAKKSGKPFALSISYKAPHRPFDPQKRWKEFYSEIKINRMNNDAPQYFDNLPDVVKFHSRNACEYWGNKLNENYRTCCGTKRPWCKEEVFQEDFQNYYALISGVDESVGKIRETLKELGLDDNTIIIYTSDNGYFCGSKQLGGKELLYEESIKAPMIVFDPRMTSANQNRWIDGMISHVDICPTILDYCDINKTKDMPGHSFVPLVTGEKQEINEYVFGENDFNDNYASISECSDPSKYQSIHSKYVRSKNFKYIRYHLCHPIIEELYAINQDPLETTNLIDNPDFKHELNKMRQLLDDFIKKYNSPM